MRNDARLGDGDHRLRQGVQQQLSAVSWGLGVASMGCFSMADAWFESGWAGQGGLSLEARAVVLSVAVLCLAWAGPLTTLAGASGFGINAFKLFQPFRGGTNFVALQALGWSLYSVCCGLGLVALLNLRNEQYLLPGELSALGALGFAGTALLNTSLHVFELTSDSDHADPAAAPRRRLAPRELKGLVCCGVALLAFAGLAAADTANQLGALPAAHGVVVLDASTAAFTLCAAVAHLWCGVYERANDGFQLFQPFSGGAEFQLLQAIGWTFMGTVVFVRANADWIRPFNVAGGATLFGAAGATAVVVLAGSVQHFSPKARYHGTEVRQRSRSFEEGASGQPTWIYFVSCAMGAAEAWLVLGVDLERGAPALRRAAAVLALVGPPLAHVGGWRMLRHRGYVLFQPLAGGMSHVLAQAFGWTLYGVLAFVWAVSHDSTAATLQRFVLPVAVISHALLLSSVRVFEGSESAAAQKLVGVPASTRFRASDVVAAVALVVTVSGDVVVLVADDDAGRDAQLLLGASLVLWVVSKAFMYAATFPGQLQAWRPFRGPEIFIMCEAVSWTLFAIGVLADVIVINGLGAGGASLAAGFSGWPSAIGCGHGFAHLLLRYGATYLVKLELRKKHDGESRTRSKAKAEDAAPAEAARSRGTSRVVAVAMAHLSFGLLCGADALRIVDPTAATTLFLVGLVLAVFGAVLTQAWVGPRSVPKFRAFQPFRGGSRFILLQAIGWTMFGIALTLALVSFNVGLAHIAFLGVVAGLGAALYVSQLTLLWSLRYFRPLPRRAVELDSRLGVLLGSFSLVLFLFTDFAVIRFGLPVSFVQPVVASAWVAACASVPLSGYVLLTTARAGGLNGANGADGADGAGRQARGFASLFLESTRSPTLVILGCALWSFTILLGALLVINSLISNDYIPAFWAATLAGGTNLASHVVLNLATISSTKELLSFLPVAVFASVAGFVFVRVFVWFVLPLLRGFLDYPMHLYAVVMKRVEGWVSPDGLQALRNVHLIRGIKYGSERKQTLDMMRPLDMGKAYSTDAKVAASGGPVLYCHGGGHLCVTSEILLHSMTPLCRAGQTVYSVEYPLSPDTRFPMAVLSLVRAVLWVGRNHCPNPECTFQCARRRVSPLDSHECDAACGLPEIQGHLCAQCGTALGTPRVQLIGDSAGGSLVAMATALLSNQDLFQRTVALGGASFADLAAIDFASFPQVHRLVILYGLLGRQTPVLNKTEASALDSWMWRFVCHVGISFIFRLYDPDAAKVLEVEAVEGGGGGAAFTQRSSLTDLPAKDLERFAPETLMVCGASDPLLPSNVAANEMLARLGHKSDLHIVPGTHAFHGFPVNWMHYLGADWTSNALPTTLLMVRFLTAGAFDEAAWQANRAKQLYRSDYSPLVVFPFFFFVVPLLLIAAAARLQTAGL